MSNISPADRKYSKDHEWVFNAGDGTVTLGITDHAQQLLTDIVYVELPEIGRSVKPQEPVAVIESVKSVSDVFSPVTGEVIDVNKKLEETPELINQDAYGKGWIVKLKVDDPAELEGMMDAAAYEAMIADEAH